MAGEIIPAPLAGYNSSAIAGAQLTFDGTAGAGLADTVCGLFSTNSGSGLVVVRDLILYISTTLVAAAGGTLSCGISATPTTEIIAATLVSALTNTRVWVSTTPGSVSGVSPATIRNYILYYNTPSAGGILFMPLVQNITAGVLRAYVTYDPILPGSTLLATGSAVAL